jgi:class 3 adenylate cyclase
MVQQTNWESKGLPQALSLRIALHAGPVFGGIDPVTGNRNYTGTHVSRAARLEPKTPPGEVYASEGFAALVAVDKVNPKTEFLCEYVKQLEWAKHYGTFPTYVVRKGPLLKFKDAGLEKA